MLLRLGSMDHCWPHASLAMWGQNTLWLVKFSYSCALLVNLFGILLKEINVKEANMSSLRCTCRSIFFSLQVPSELVRGHANAWPDCSELNVVMGKLFHHGLTMLFITGFNDVQLNPIYLDFYLPYKVEYSMCLSSTSHVETCLEYPSFFEHSSFKFSLFMLEDELFIKGTLVY